MNKLWLCGLSLMLTGTLTAPAQELRWRPVTVPPPADRTAEKSAGPFQVSLGHPEPLETSRVEPQLVPVSYSPQNPPRYRPIVRAKVSEPSAAESPPPIWPGETPTNP